MGGLNFNPVWRGFPALVEGLAVSFQLMAGSLLLGIAIGIVVAAMRNSGISILTVPARLYILGIRNLPLIVIIFIIYFALPETGLRIPRTPSFIIGLGAYCGAYIAEIIRGGLLAIPKGMTEAGQAIGLTRIQIQLYIIGPMLLRIILPNMSNTVISTFKDTSVAVAIGVPELTFAARKINLESFRVIETWVVVSGIYILSAYLLAALLRMIERRFTLERGGPHV